MPIAMNLTTCSGDSERYRPALRPACAGANAAQTMYETARGTVWNKATRQLRRRSIAIPTMTVIVTATPEQSNPAEPASSASQSRRLRGPS